jgi:hypothetical protein
MNKKLTSSFYSVLMDEFRNSESYNKFLILGIVFNIPPFWLPFVTQLITITFFFLFIKNYMKAKNLSLQNKVFDKRLLFLLPSFLAICLQLPFFWIPFITQFISLLAIGVQFFITQEQRPEEYTPSKA